MAKTLIRLLERALEGASALCMLVLTLVVLVDVVGRDLFNRPLSWATEVLEVVVAVMVFLVYPILGYRERHITVDLIRVGPAMQRVQRLVGALFGAVAFALICWCLGRQSLRAFDYGEASPTLGLPLGDVLATLSALAALSVIGFLLAGGARAISILRPSRAQSNGHAP